MDPDRSDAFLGLPLNSPPPPEDAGSEPKAAAAAAAAAAAVAAASSLMHELRTSPHVDHHPHQLSQQVLLTTLKYLSSLHLKHLLHSHCKCDYYIDLSFRKLQFCKKYYGGCQN